MRNLQWETLETTPYANYQLLRLKVPDGWILKILKVLILETGLQEDVSVIYMPDINHVWSV